MKTLLESSIPLGLKIEKLPAFKPIIHKINFLRYGEKINLISFE